MDRMKSAGFYALVTIIAIVIAFVIALASIVANADPVVEHAEPAGDPLASPPAGPADELVTGPANDVPKAVLDVDRGIRFVLRDTPCWGLAADSVARREMAEKIVKAAEAYEVPALLLTVMAERESSFQVEAIGAARGEVGILQVHGLAARGCDLSTAEGQLACGASWLRKAFETCGTWERAITAYAAGYCSAPKDSKLLTVVLSRLRQWQRAQLAIDGCYHDDPGHWVCGPQQGTCNDAIRIIARARTRPKGPRSGLPRVQAP